MARGKYSVLALKHWPNDYEFRFNCYGQEPEPWTLELADACAAYNDKTMFGNYDEEGYDYYGYSAFDSNGNFVGHGQGVDRAGWTEMDYLTLQDIPEEHRDSFYYFNS
jgi:hypothetical protein